MDYILQESHGLGNCGPALAALVAAYQNGTLRADEVARRLSACRAELAALTGKAFTDNQKRHSLRCEVHVLEAAHQTILVMEGH